MTHARYLTLLVCLVIPTGTWCQDHPTANAPPNMSPYKHTSTGVLYTDKKLVSQYTRLKREVDTARGQVFRDGGARRAPREKLASLEKELAEVVAKVEEETFLVEPFQVFSRRDTQSFELGEARQILITSDDVIVRGWNGKNIKCVIEKFVLGEEELDESEFEAIAVQHEVRLADDLVGMSDEARDASEAEFLASEKGKELDEKARKNRAAFVAEVHDSYWMYRPLQGHEVNVLKIAGLSSQEGNKHMTGATKSLGGGGTMGGYWKRSAKVTIYVPKCQHVAIRGCLKSVDIKSVNANLILTTHGSQDRSYGSDFAVRDIDGNVLIYQVPIRTLEGIRGNINFRQTDEYTNTGTAHDGKFRTSSSPPPDPTTISAIEGNLQGEFVRADLRLKDLTGKLDVMNEYGNTELLIDKSLPAAAHRILSHSGVIRAAMAKHDVAGIKVYAFTQTGTAQVAFRRDEFDDKSFGGSDRSWYGFQSVGVPFGFAALKRPSDAWDNQDRSNGLDLISNGGAVIVGP